MNTRTHTSKLAAAALLCAIGVIIPMYSPLRVILPPAASYTLGVHAPIFIAMFISPAVAVAVSLGTAAGFLLAGFHLPIVFRALSHVVFAFIGAAIIRKWRGSRKSLPALIIFSFYIGVIHGVFEVAAVVLFYFAGDPAAMLAEGGFLLSVVLMIGVGTVAHSMVDFGIACAVLRPMRRHVRIFAKDAI